MSEAIFQSRRARFLSAMGERSVAVLRAASLSSRNSDVDHDWRQASDFYYLTGFDEPDAVCVLAPGHEGKVFTLFVLPRDPEKEQWTGRRAGVDGATAIHGADEAYTLDQLDEQLATLLDGAERLYYRVGDDPGFDARVLKVARRHRTMPRLGVIGADTIIDPVAIVSEQRLIKDAADLAALRRACEITSEGHAEAMRYARPGMHEYEIQAALEYVFRLQGSSRNGYQSIVAGGDNGTILHYTTNRMRVPQGSLVLIDAGCEYEYCTSDITRCFPIDGHFEGASREVYEAVLACQIACIEATRAGRSFQSVHDLGVRALTEAMVQFGWLAGDVDARIEDETYKKYYMHRTSHWLGLDVHDVGLYRHGPEWRTLLPGHVITVEPGLYVPSDDDTVDPRFRGIGVRIEDDVLVTVEGPEVLTAMCPKLMDDVEATMRDSPHWVLPGRA